MIRRTLLAPLALAGAFLSTAPSLGAKDGPPSFVQLLATASGKKALFAHAKQIHMVEQLNCYLDLASMEKKPNATLFVNYSAKCLGTDSKSIEINTSEKELAIPFRTAAGRIAKNQIKATDNEAVTALKKLLLDQYNSIAVGDFYSQFLHGEAYGAYLKEQQTMKTTNATNTATTVGDNVKKAATQKKK